MKKMQLLICLKFHRKCLTIQKGKLFHSFSKRGKKICLSTLRDVDDVQMNDEMIAGNQAHFLLYIGQHPASALELYLCKDWRLEGESRHQPDWGGVASAGHRMVGPGAC